MSVSDLHESDITRLLQSGSPFFVYCLPGGQLCQADVADVHLTPWPGCEDPMAIPEESTAEEQYRESLGLLIGRLRQRGGKTVISRVICGRHEADMARVALDFFAAYPTSYRTLFYTPQTGAWLGASPELLYRVDANRLYTMALAGTRPYSDDGLPWDAKNLEEHRLVADFVEDALVAAQAEYHRSPLATLRYGSIEHLLTEFTADAATVDIDSLRDSLHPTPAVGGYPREAALADIAELERHRRNLYAGLIEFTDHESGTRYCIVNLRCMQFDATRYCIYAGGGITPDSDPAAEWAETDSKSAWLRQRMG